MKKTIINNIFLLLIFISINIKAQQTPAKAQSESILITGVVAHIGNGEIINNAAIGFDKGKITFIGSQNNVVESDFSKIINAQGKHVYPGFIATNTTIGLIEIDAVRATKDARETGYMLPHIRSVVAFNTESKIIETLRPNGVLIAQVAPRGGIISGTSSIVQLDAWNWEDAVIKIDDGIHINWPSIVPFNKRSNTHEKSSKSNSRYIKTVEKVKYFMNEAKAYSTGKQSPKNIPLEAVQGLFNATKTFFVHVNGEKEIVDAVTFCKEVGINKIVIVHGKEAHKITDLLVKNNIPVLIPRPHRLPSSDDENIHLPYKLAKILTDKGVVVGISMQGDMGRMQTRNLPFYAGTFAAYGLGKEEALKLITSNAAKILGIDHKVGTLKKGLNATLFISKGDALDMRTNNVTNAFIEGREISLETHQTKLWNRYLMKYKNKKKP